MWLFLFNVRYVRNQESINVNYSLSICMPDCGVEGSKKLRGKKRKEGIVSDFPGGRVGSTPPTNAGDGVWFLVWEDFTCCRATKPVYHNCWGHKPQLLSQCTYSPRSATREITTMRRLCTAVTSSPRSLQLEKAPTQQQGPTAAVNKLTNLIKFFKKEGIASRVQATFVHRNSTYIHPPLTGD